MTQSADRYDTFLYSKCPISATLMNQRALVAYKNGNMYASPCTVVQHRWSVDLHAPMNIYNSQITHLSSEQ